MAGGFDAQIIADLGWRQGAVLGTNELTLAALDGYQRFDADWVSFSDETEAISMARDLDS